MRSILEQAIVHQLNGETDKADALFHQFIVSRARQIHESMRNGEDPLVEGWDEQPNADTYFTEDDLADLEDDNDEDFGGEDEDMSDADEDFGDDMGSDDVEDLDDELEAHEEEDQELADEVDELAAKLAELEAKFAEMSGDEDDFGGDEDEEPVVDDMEDEDFSDDSNEDFSTEEDEDDFDRLGESVTSELEKVAVTMADGKEAGAGNAFAQNKTSPIVQKKIGERQGGKAVEVKGATHSGFERETAPSVADMKKRRNTMKKAGDNLSGVKGGAEKGDGKELGGKAVTKNTKSPLPSKKS